jgi:trigger factor
VVKEEKMQDIQEQVQQEIDKQMVADVIVDDEAEDIEYPIVKVEETEYCKLSISYEGDPETIKEKRDEAVAELRKVTIPGFRKGKAPDYAIRARCKNRIKDWICREMASQAYDDAIFETNAKPIGTPEIKEISLKGDKFTCEMNLLRKPEFELGQYTGFEIPAPDIDRDVEGKVLKGIGDWRMRAGESEPYGEDDVVELGDQVTLSLMAKIDGEEFTGGTSEGELYTVGSGKYPGFDDGILGLKAGESTSFVVKLPDELPEVGGKNCNFLVTIHMGTKRKRADLDEEFFKKLGVKDLDDLKSKLAQVARVEISQEESNKVSDQIIKRIVESHEFEIPDFLKEGEAQNLAHQSGLNWKDLNDETKADLVSRGEKSVRLSLILDPHSFRQPLIWRSAGPQQLQPVVHCCERLEIRQRAEPDRRRNPVFGWSRSLQPE